MDSEETLLKKFYLTFDLHRAGKDMMRQNLHRKYPEANDEEIQSKLVAWLRNRPPDTLEKPYKANYYPSLNDDVKRNK
jgi:Rv0078B-related antitoxin